VTTSATRCRHTWRSVELDGKGFVVTRDGFVTSVPGCSLSVTFARDP
jgi:hypothetical protein